jgi:hypothetical protein
MKRIKGLALAAFAVAAMAALPAAASASGGFVADSYPATLHGSQVGWLTINPGGHEIGCNAAQGAMTFEGTLAKPYPSATTSKTSDPKCNSGSVELKGCQLQLHPGTATVDIVTSGCGPVNVWSSSCLGYSSIGAQSGIAAKFENYGSGSEAGFRVVFSNASVQYTVAKGNLCEKAGTYTLLLNGEFKVTATNAESKAIGTSVISGDVPLGLFVDGGSSSLAAPEYPVHVKGGRIQFGGEPLGEIKLFAQGERVKVTCTGASLDGGELSGPAKEFTLNASYSGCMLSPGPFPVSVSMSSCHYAFSKLEKVSESEFNSAAAIACSKEADLIVISGVPACTLKIPAQTLGGEPTALTNLFEGYERSVTALMFGSGVHYTTVGANCAVIFNKSGWGKEHTGEDASLESDMLLNGVFPG